MNSLIKSLRLIAVAFLSIGSLGAESPRPNVLFIAIDDLRNFVNCFGYEQVQTPNIDRLALRSTLFTNAHNQAPMCGPSRASLMTGVMPHHSGVYGFVDWRSAPALRQSIPLNAHFTRMGYETLSGGKIYHSNTYRAGEWSEVYSKALHKEGTWGEKSVKGTDRALREYHGFQVCGPSDLPESAFHDTITADLAVEKLKGAYEKPWFLAVGFTKPHLPWIAPRKYFDLYDPDTLVLPEVLADDIADTPDAAQFPSHRPDALGIDREPEGSRRLLHAYLATISYMDAQVGKVLDALEAREDASNTVIVLWSDHGWHLGEKQCWRKFTLWDESTRNPLLISVPGQDETRISTKPVQLVDIYPTLVELCGLPAPETRMDGRSLVPLIEDPEAAWPWPAITCNGRDSYALTFERWKYNRFFDGSEELYDHLNDPLEHTNLAGRPEFAEIQAACAEYLPKVSHPNLTDGKEWILWITDYPPLDAWRRELKEIEDTLETTGKVPDGIYRRYSREQILAARDAATDPETSD